MMIISSKELWVWSSKRILINALPSKNQKSIKLLNIFILLEILGVTFKTEDNLSELPFSTLTTARLMFTSSKLEEQSKDETDARNLRLKNHYDQ